MKIGKQITESIHTHLDVTRTFANELAVSLLESVRVPDPERRMDEYPHQLSGGLRQRVCIAVALGVRSAAAPRRRADDRARRDGAGPGARPARGPAARALHGPGARHPRPRCRRRARRRSGRDVRRPGGREGVDRHAVLRHEDALHRGAAALDPEDRRSPATRGCRRSPAVHPTSSTCPPAAASRRAARTCRTAAARSSRRCCRANTPGHEFRCWFPVGTPEGAEALARNRADRRGHLMAGTGTAHLRPESEVAAAGRGPRGRVPRRRRAR